MVNFLNDLIMQSKYTFRDGLHRRKKLAIIRIKLFAIHTGYLATGLLQRQRAWKHSFSQLSLVLSFAKRKYRLRAR